MSSRDPEPEPEPESVYIVRPEAIPTVDRENGDTKQPSLGTDGADAVDDNSAADDNVKVDEEVGVGVEVIYSINDTPPWPLSVLLGFQHYLTACGSTLTVPLILAGPLCLVGDDVGLSEVVGTIFFVSGIATLLQTSLGVRLPIIQGTNFGFLAPAFSILSLPQWQCPARVLTPSSSLSTLLPHPEVGGERHREIWQARLREIQGAVIIASLSQILLGFTGLFSLVLRYTGPLVVAPTVTLVCLPLFEAAANKSAAMWWIALMTLALIVLFSQCLHKVLVPVPKVGITWRPRPACHGLSAVRLPLFGIFPVLLAMATSWLLCLALTMSGVLPSHPDAWGYRARTDARSHVLAQASWVRVPYPGQWGVPTVSVSGALGMLAGVLASMVESVGDYYACARLSGAPPPPAHAVNRGLGMEGVACVMAGAFGTGNGTTSFSENVAAIGVTRVASRRVAQTAGLLMVVLGCLGKVGAMFVTIPDPVAGGIFLGMFGMITAVGLSNLRHVALQKPRNMCVLGLSLFLGLAIPKWVSANKGAINTGVVLMDQILGVLLSTSMFVGGFVGFVLDNLLPGTDEERGLTHWREETGQDDEGTEKREGRKRGGGGGGEGGGGERGSITQSDKVYTTPLFHTLIDHFPKLGRLPFCPPARKRTPPSPINHHHHHHPTHPFLVVSSSSSSSSGGDGHQSGLPILLPGAGESVMTDGGAKNGV
ncbi:solute carrier family 23 member 1-like [Babylonia areolata]|uniref:solute carrier family 23 member 1-like n=1 Tax=Babylonia areolata TaxID=304850 RepID=UPI003FD10123